MGNPTFQKACSSLSSISGLEGASVLSVVSVDKLTASQRIDRTSLVTGYLFGSHTTKLAVNANCQGPGMDSTEFCRLETDRYRCTSLVFAVTQSSSQPDTTGMEDDAKVQDDLPNGCTIFWLLVIARTERQLNLLIMRKPKNKHLPKKVLLLARTPLNHKTLLKRKNPVSLISPRDVPRSWRKNRISR